MKKRADAIHEVTQNRWKPLEDFSFLLRVCSWIALSVIIFPLLARAPCFSFPHLGKGWGEGLRAKPSPPTPLPTGEGRIQSAVVAGALQIVRVSWLSLYCLRQIGTKQTAAVRRIDRGNFADKNLVLLVSIHSRRA